MPGPIGVGDEQLVTGVAEVLLVAGAGVLGRLEDGAGRRIDLVEHSTECPGVGLR